MIPPEHFHSCYDCQKFTIDLEKQQPPLYPGRDKQGSPSDIFFFDATLEDVLNGLTSGCELCLWLDSLWGGDPSSDRERYGVLKASKDTSSIVVCTETYSMSLVDRYPVDEITFFGLWEEGAPSRPHWGKCLVLGRCSVDVFTTPDDDAGHLIRNRPINRFPGSAESLRHVRKWLQKCQTSHAKCRAVSQNYMPLRVLRISSGCGSCDFHVTLDTTTTVSESIEPFAALSYCWGGDQLYKTTKARMQYSDFSLQWCKLSRSLQDAIKVTVALGLECLWVDSMCIVQDDEDDKVVQIADMARIYSQANVTIIASRASRAIDGFLGEINLTSRTLLAVRLPFRCPGKDRTVGSAYLTHIEGSRNSSEPIDSRAWTLQERYLSNRVVEFGSLQTGWTCATSSASSDSYVDGWRWDKNHEGHKTQMSYLYADLLADLAQFSIQRSSTAWVRDWLDNRWETVLGEYTPRLLSVPTDRILAISGVAEIFLSHMRNDARDETEEYLAGMWKSTLPSMLCWRAVGGVEDRGRLQPTPEIYQGPSWSWVGVNCGVSFIFGRACNRDCRAVLLDADVRLTSTSAKCGSVNHATLTLKGRMRRAFWNLVDGTLEIDRNEEPQDTDTNTRKVQLATIYPDTSNSLSGLFKNCRLRAPVQLLEVGHCVGLKKRGPVGLVLEPIHASIDQDLPRFRRLGLFHIDTRRILETTQAEYPDIKRPELENLKNFFEGKEAHVIQLE
ncbi:heterokaryon incompatibility protein-domain-containing protein [Nemania abortiva]|nr:heterokaryon incompatibility protein-domain-containing protein [Nemania abortiva]